MHQPAQLPGGEAGREDLAPALQAALAELAKARDYARRAHADPWQFAVEIAQLLALGATTSDLRWLVMRGYAASGCERSAARGEQARRLNGADARTFRHDLGLALPPRTCFVLTEAGAAVLGDLPRAVLPMARPGAEAEAAPAIMPRWDRLARVLRVGPHVVKRFRRPSPNQEAVLAAFEEEGWPEHVFDPLPPAGDIVPQKRLRDTVAWLNRRQEQPLIRFTSDGKAEGVCWQLAVREAASPAVEARPRLRRAA